MISDAPKMLIWQPDSLLVIINYDVRKAAEKSSSTYAVVAGVLVTRVRWVTRCRGRCTGSVGSEASTRLVVIGADAVRRITFRVDIFNFPVTNTTIRTSHSFVKSKC